MPGEVVVAAARRLVRPGVRARVAASGGPVTSASARKGARWERELVAYLRAEGFDAERAYGAGRPEDVGDIAGIPGVVLEAKSCRRFELSAWCDEAEREAANRGDGSMGVVAVKAPGKPAAGSYLVVRLGAAGVPILRALARMGHAGSVTA